MVEITLYQIPPVKKISPYENFLLTGGDVFIYKMRVLHMVLL